MLQAIKVIITNCTLANTVLNALIYTWMIDSEGFVKAGWVHGLNMRLLKL